MGGVSRCLLCRTRNRHALAPLFACVCSQRATHCQQRPGSGDGTMDKLGLAGKDSAAADKVAAKGEAAAAVARSSSSFRIGTQVAEQV